MNINEMIHGGGFGTSAPFMNPPEPPNNMIPFGGYNVYQANQPQYNYYNNNLYNEQYNTNNGFVFQPVTSYYAPQSPYGGQSPYGQQQQYNYYNPYGNTFANVQNPYTANGYYNYTPFQSPLAMSQYQQQQIEMFKLKYRLANYYLGNEVDEEKLDRMCNPNNEVNRKTNEELREEAEFKHIQYISDVANGIYPEVEGPSRRQARILNLMSDNFHREFDDHSMCQFLEEDLWKLQREEWIRKYIKRNANRDLSSIYNSKDYNELLNLHNSSSSPYVNQILDNSRYDNNLDDIEIGVQMAMDKARRRRAILEGQVPTFISSEETQKRRHEFTQQLMNQIYRKGEASNV